MFWKHVWMVDNDAFDTQDVLNLCRENCPVDPVSDDDSMLTHLAMNISMYNEMKTDNIESLRSSVMHAGVATYFRKSGSRGHMSHALQLPNSCAHAFQ